MKLSVAKCLPVFFMMIASTAISAAAPRDLNPQLAAYAKARAAEFAQIPAERKHDLQKLAAYIRTQHAARRDAKLVYVCTHNSRRSQIAQMWAQAAALYYGVASVQAFSGGTEVTAFNPRAVAALERSGFVIKKTSEGSNPIYQVSYSPSSRPLTAFSKKYGDAPNPQESFAVVMTCSNADKSCPIVHGASLRVATHYVDPKATDGTPRETQAYDECVREISRETLYLFSRVKR